VKGTQLVYRSRGSSRSETSEAALEIEQKKRIKLGFSKLLMRIIVSRKKFSRFF
jgi:hypothetical protein